MSNFLNQVQAQRTKDCNSATVEPITKQNLNNDPNLQTRLTNGLRNRLKQKLSTAEIPKLLDCEVGAMVKRHFDVGGPGHTETHSIFNMIKLDA